MTATAILTDLRAAGFSIRADPDNRLTVAPADQLRDEQRAAIRQHKAHLLQLLDVETLLQALSTAGSAGLDWHEGTPTDWGDTRLLDAGQVLYSTGRMVNVLGRRYLKAQAPSPPPLGPLIGSGSL